MIAESRQPPGPRTSISGIFHALRDPLGFLLEMRERYGDVVMFRRGKFFLVVNPDGIKHILQDNHTNYVKGALYKRATRPLIGDGLLNSDGTAWRSKRRLAQPAFRQDRHEAFVATIVEQTEILCQKFSNYASLGARFDLHNELSQHSLRIVLHLIFGEDAGANTQELIKGFLAADHEMNPARLFNPINVPEWVPTPSNLRLRKGLRSLDDFVFAAIRRRREKHQGADLLSSYVRARDEDTGQALSDQQIRDEVVTLMAAGHETVSDSMTWALYLLLSHPAIYGKICSEAILVLGNKPPELSCLAGLCLTTMVFQEAMRLYPSAWGFVRVALQDDVICGYRVTAGALVMLSPYVVHRDSQIWERPESFEPERFLPNEIAQRHRFAWFPFSGGPRLCVGLTLAMLEAQITLSMLARAVELELVPGQSARPLPGLSLKPEGGIWVRARARNESVTGSLE